MKIQVALLINGKEVESKIVEGEAKADRYESDMAAKHQVLFTNKPYAVKRLYLDNL